MEITNNDVKVLGRLVNITTDNILTDSQQIYDSTYKEFQADLNAQILRKINDLEQQISQGGSTSQSIVDTINLKVFTTDDTPKYYSLEEQSESDLYDRIRDYQVKYPNLNEFPLISNVLFQTQGTSDSMAVNKIFDKMWYVDYTSRLSCTIQRMQLQHTSDQDSTLSMFTINVEWYIVDGERQTPQVTVRENFIRISNSGDGTQFLNDKGVYSKVPVQDLPIDLITTGDGTKFLSDDGTYKTINTNNDNLYEEIDMRVYKISVASSISEEDKQKLIQYKNDCKNGEPAVLFMKPAYCDYYTVYNIVNPSEYNDVDEYSADKEWERNVLCTVASASFLNSSEAYDLDAIQTTYNIPQISFYFSDANTIRAKYCRTSVNTSVLSNLGVGELSTITQTSSNCITTSESSGLYTARVPKPVVKEIDKSRTSVISNSGVIFALVGDILKEFDPNIDYLYCIQKEFGSSAADGVNFESFTLTTLQPFNGSCKDIQFTYTGTGQKYSVNIV